MIILISVIINYFFLKYHEKISKELNLYDIPDDHRKFHKRKVPLTGGFLFLINICLYFLYSLVHGNILFIFENYYKNLIFIISLIIFYLIGYFDDKYDFSAKKRLLIFTVIILINLYFIPELHLKYIKISFLDDFHIGNYSFIWTLICFLLFINAFNFFDGINLQSAGFIYSICFFFFFKNIFFDFIVVIFIANTFFSYLNYHSKTFLGNSGSFYLPFLFGTLFISSYNNSANIVADEIVVLMLIPGLDLLRLFFQRIIKKTNPMTADNNHIHHYLLNRFANIESVLIIQSLIWIPLIISQFFGYINLILIVQTICYFLIITRYKS